MQISEARDRYIRWLSATQDLSPHTIRAYICDIVALERYLGADAHIDALERERLVDFMESQRRAGLSSTSLKRRASGLRGLCSWLSSTHLLTSDPFAGIVVRVGQARRLPRVLSSIELHRLFSTLKREAGAKEQITSWSVLERPHEATTLLAAAIMIATGVRVNEVVSVTCQDIDLQEGVIRVFGKGRRERQVFLTNDWIKNLTSAYLCTRVSLGVNHPYLLFNSCRERLTASTMRLRLAKASVCAGLDPVITPHMLRHTAATRLIEAGVDIRYIQRLLGHASLSTTEIYTHVSDPALRKVLSEADILRGFV